MTHIEVNTQRPQSAGEEFANSVSHGLGFLVAAASVPVLGSLSLLKPVSAAHGIALGVFVASMMLLYLASALFHGLPPGRAKRWFCRLDHATIYVFIAGSYTPFAQGSMPDSHWLMLALVWGMAAVGVLITLTSVIRNPIISTSLYVVMGWLAVAAAMGSFESGPDVGRQLLISGGIAYTAGAVLFLLDHRMRYAHFVWHLFVLLGSALHFAAMLSRSGFAA